jgi:hypothetical protein
VTSGSYVCFTQPLLPRHRARNRRKAVSAYLGGHLRAFVYVDAFNFYYRAVKGTAYKWVDLNALFQLVFPNHSIERIKYFTAHVKALPHDLQQPLRQQIYLRAISTLPNVSIHLGQFASHSVRMPLTASLGGQTQFVEVLKTEEKGSDVNLAAHLVHDAHRGLFEVAIVVTNDSDLVEPVKIVVQEIGKTVGILNPCTQPASGLRRAASFYRELRHTALAKCQFPAIMVDATGTFRKPASW